MIYRSLAIILALITLVSANSAFAQDDPNAPPADVDKLIKEGAADALEGKFSGGKTPAELRWISQAWRNRAARSKDAAAKQRAFADAEKRYRKWIAAAEKQGEAIRRNVDAAQARTELAQMILSYWAIGDLDEFEISGAKRFDRKRLQSLLTIARDEFTKARDVIQPLLAEMGQREEEFLALGVEQTLLRLRFDTQYGLAWTTLYLAQIDPQEGEKRITALRAVEKDFAELLSGDISGPVMHQCRIGAGISLREQGRHADAEKVFKLSMGEEVDGGIAAQARYELGRSQITAGKFKEARVTLEPLLQKDPAALKPEERAMLFYLNLARLWDANSFLLEAAEQQKSAAGSTSSVAILKQASATRASGLQKMNRLAQQGGFWPSVVQDFVNASIDVNADPRTLGPTELLFIAQRQMESKKLREALERLQEASTREGVDSELMGQILFELGACHFQLDELRPAAETFEQLSRKIKGHAKAPQAATFAYQLWARIAEQSKQKADYERLAAVLLNLLESYPDHEKRVEAMWWLPLALQAAGRYGEASEQFGKVPKSSSRWEEAQFRHVLCERLALEAGRSKLSADEFTAKAKKAADRLVAYSREALPRAPAGAGGEETRKWAAEAVLNAAEVLLAAGAGQDQGALDVLKDFEKQPAAGPLMGRVLAARIRAYRGLRQFDLAARVVQQYLEAVPAEKAGPVLSLVAQGMEEELDRLREAGRLDEARKLASESIATFQQLEKWCEADPKREKDAEIVRFGLARMYYFAGQLDEAAALATKVLAKNPQNGNYQRLAALIVTERLGDAPTPAQCEEARTAWEALLKDPTLRSKAPERYWEARLNWLRLLLRESKAADVEKAIRQERIWFPDLGGAPWKERFEALYAESLEKTGGKAATQETPR